MRDADYSVAAYTLMTVGSKTRKLRKSFGFVVLVADINVIVARGVHFREKHTLLYDYSPPVMT